MDQGLFDGNMENVGYTKPGKAGVYNILIMEEVQTLGALFKKVNRV